MASHESRAVQAARSQSLFREVNECVEEVFSSHSLEIGILCECANDGCGGTITVSRDEYEDVRRIPTRFFVLPGHELEEVERVVSVIDRYAIVEKFGEGGTFATTHDARRRQKLHAA